MPVNLLGALPSFEHTVTFRVHEQDGIVREGSLVGASVVLRDTGDE